MSEPPLLSGTDPDHDAKQTVDDYTSTITQAFADRPTKQEVRATARNWVLYAVLAAFIVSLGVSFAAYRLGASNQAQITAQATVEQNRAANLASAQRQIGDLNKVLTSQGKPTVTTPNNSSDASAAVVLAKVLAQLPRSVIQMGPSGQPGVPGEVGPSGQPGQIGSPGPAGSPGSPGSPGVAGSPGAAGTAGTPGAAGSVGETGPAGAAGQDGQPPVSWTITNADGSTTSCQRASGFDASSPTYTCTGGSGTTPTQTESPSAAPLVPAIPSPLAPVAPVEPLLPTVPAPTTAPTPGLLGGLLGGG